MLISEIDKRHEDRVSAIAKTTGDLEAWHQDSEGAVDDLKLKVNKMTKYWDRSFAGAATTSPGVFSASPSSLEQTAAPTSAENTAARPSGHHVFMTTWVDGIGGHAPQFHSPANGMTLTHPVDSTLLHSADTEILDYQHPHASVHHPDNGRLPKLNFPFYEGDTTRVWISQAEDYFEMYDVPPRRWVKVSRMHFNGATTRWIESLEQPNKIPWSDFCKLLHDRFRRDQRDRLSRQMFHIHQTSTVLDHVERFSTLFDQLKAYQPNPDLHYYTTRFVDGLRHDIRMVVALQRPSDLDPAYSLALLQEEMANSSKKSEFNAYDRGASFKVVQKAAHPP
jgi:hypothetical protein